MTEIAIGKPEIKEGINSYRYAWANLGLVVDVDRLDDDGTGEVRFWHKNGDANAKLLHYSKLNLLSPVSCSQTAKRLAKNAALDWDTVLTYVTSLTLEAMRRGKPIYRAGNKPDITEITYQLNPILEQGQPTTIYSPGGSAKSYLALYIASLIQYGEIGMSLSASKWVPTKGNVLYLDWEATERDIKRRAWFVKRGLGITSNDEIFCRSCETPLVQDLPNILKIISDNNINFIVIDSQMAAAENSPNQQADASRFYNALRSTGCTSLTLDHVAKADWRLPSSQAVGPFGSVTKFNRSRSQFELQKYQKPGEPTLKLKMIHRKHNEGMLLKDIGVQIDFSRDENDRLDMVLFSWLDLKNDPDFNTAEDDLEGKIYLILSDGPMSVKQLAKAIETSDNSIRGTLNRMIKKDPNCLIHNLKEGTWEIGEIRDIR